ncbi:(2Fe-2S) ferredoxin domain-containing protein [Serpentinicella alkaliphila]|uniref:NAD(P)-dependent iron-only hydrogenase iron-sulfur protein n=1 Tax=Serpentinicella alkaliphila TaxID=1734049 RepID=A0A4R2THX3_9FIRM|nr:(2Fe-2S) ferredoxin domain-containing protein [Serpentinicella alkaliphila]QUH24644.1 (2Fe-2S) ferredoxin domain-containing protein [Serpentinicella alkaliphila]TCQ03098.1 NAD(P)-dependent iron-only hydrogenase iron-sulfur protein [Serpentinicella alkaliphila]
MSTIKSLDELKKIREQSLKKMELRTVGAEKDSIKILIGMATCGIAAGARDTLSGILDEIDKQNLDNVYVVQVGCMGYCYAEPVVQVNMPGKEPIVYGNIDAKKGREIINKHIQKGELLEDLIISKSFHRV